MKSILSFFCCLILATVSAKAIIATNAQMLLGNPSGAITDPNNHDHYLHVRTVDAMDYCDNHGGPNWVSWNLTDADTGTTSRTDAWSVDTNLPPSFHVITTGTFGGGYDRGHMCPSADRTDNTYDNTLVFFMSNIIPQASGNNQGPWAVLEDYTRTLLTTSECLIVSGPYLFDGTRTPNNSLVWVPKWTWKIIVVAPLGAANVTNRITASTRVIAIKMPNSTTITYGTWPTYVTNAHQIEVDTGYKFFSALDTNVAEVLRWKEDGAAAPSISSFTPSSAAAGSSVTISGANFTRAAWVIFNNAYTTNFTVNSSSSITVNVPATASSGQIKVIAPGGLATSASSFTVGASGSVIITGQPASQTVTSGTTANFSVTATGSGTLSYQWKTNGVSLVNGGNIAGATAATLTVTSATVANAASYTCIVTNSISSATSSAATLTVVSPAPQMAVTPATGLTSSGIQGGPFSPSSQVYTITNSGTATLNWTAANAANWLTLSSTSGSLAVNGSTTVTASINASANTLAVGNYSDTIGFTNTVNGAGNTTRAASLTVSVAGPDPQITSQPVSATFVEGSLGSLSVSATGTQPITYQWQKNNGVGTYTNITAATASTYSKTIVAADAGSYRVVASNSVGTATSSVATITTTTSSTNGVQISTLSSFIYTQNFNSLPTNSTGYTWSNNTTLLGWYADKSGGSSGSSFSLVDNGSAADSVNGLHDYGTTGSIDRALGLTSDDGSGSFPSNVAFGLRFVNDTPVTISNMTVVFTGEQWHQTTNNNTLQFYYRVTNAPVTSVDASNLFVWTSVSALNFAAPHTGTSGALDGNLAANQSAKSNLISGINVPASRELWLRWFLPAVYPSPGLAVDNLTVTFGVPPFIVTQPQAVSAISGGSAVFSVGASGSSTLSYQWQLKASGDPGFSNLAGQTSASYTRNGLTLADDASQVRVVISNSFGAATSSAAALSVSAPPSIAASPTNQTVVAGNPASFTVTATGTPPLSYRWRRNGSNISGATDTALNIASAQQSDAGTYDVVVTNSVGAATSLPATLVVWDPPSISTEPASVTVSAGSDVVFSVVATGSPPLTYQWRQDGENLIDAGNISGSQTAALTIHNVHGSDNAAYAVFVQNAAGSILSSAADLNAVPSTLRLVNISTNLDGTPALLWSVIPGDNYSFEYKDNLDDGQWTPIGNYVPAGASLAVSDPSITNGQRFYRLNSVEGGSEVAGYLNISLLGTSDNYLSLPFVRPSAAELLVQSVSGNVVTVTPTPGWIANQFVYTTGTQSNSYYLRFTSGAAEGRIYSITANDSASVTLNLGSDDLSHVATNDAISIEPYWTLGTIFPNGTGVNVSPTVGNRSTEVLIPDLTGSGINLSATVIDFFQGGFWKQVGQGNANHNDDVIPANSYVIVRHNVATNTTLNAAGVVVSSKLVTLLRAQTGLVQDNSIALTRPVAVSLNASGLISSGAFQASPLPGSRTDELLTFDNSVASRNKSASAVYYYWNSAWRKVGFGGTDVGADTLLPGTGFIIRKGTNSVSATWTNAPNW